MATPDILDDLLRLPAVDRARLAQELLRSLDDGDDADASERWDAELERRAAEVRAGTADTMSETEFREQLRLGAELRKQR